ncbi:hypothetical protein SERLA73DRAFT_183452 [Serpula lacrymans var. lacrymans S7.3]|uniref:Uncharacterized protein n=2 Tax=Serpula lacrymans var. lacrymans TaxID=341189 RepID=F8PZX3_SERL3|nr:uncharacterized protein SERLADRAFT_470648 [Serpula lacrymans var. lacrymans S7.9]EGN98445.1 hypothetical protein SERLA73DRAFT_183452 [Serpula lacrymans var. lacrymans S7.3]EGO24024.1 hypothetical protein SERLADRAFT_470648 [Serpula lacrymans var. lacrymans S7.9]
MLCHTEPAATHEPSQLPSSSGLRCRLSAKPKLCGAAMISMVADHRRRDLGYFTEGTRQVLPAC